MKQLLDQVLALWKVVCDHHSRDAETINRLNWNCELLNVTQLYEQFADPLCPWALLNYLRYNIIGCIMNLFLTTAVVLFSSELDIMHDMSKPL